MATNKLLLVVATLATIYGYLQKDMHNIKSNIIKCIPMAIVTTCKVSEKDYNITI